jgi:hypothetical protein
MEKHSEKKWKNAKSFSNLEYFNKSQSLQSWNILIARTEIATFVIVYVLA